MRFKRFLTTLPGLTLLVASAIQAQDGLIMPPAPGLPSGPMPPAPMTPGVGTGHEVVAPGSKAAADDSETTSPNVFDARILDGSPEAISGGWVDADKRGLKPVVVRPRYGSIHTHGAYRTQMVPGGGGAVLGWQPGGEPGRTGSPDYYSAPGQNGPLYQVHQMSGTPWGTDHSVYQYHFGPGFYRTQEAGHYRFPYYTYRAPWYFPGHPIYNRFTNQPW